MAGFRLVISDDHTAPRAAIARHFQEASWQRCQVHVARLIPNREACPRLVTALAKEQSDEWVSGRRDLDVARLTDELPITCSPALRIDDVTD